MTSTLFLNLACCFVLGMGGATVFAVDTFPFEKGNYWTYQARLKSIENDGKTKEEILLWRMRVIEKASSNGFTIALMEGHPAQLTLGPRESKAGRYWMVGFRGRRYYQLEAADETRSVEKLLADPSKFAARLTPQTMLLDLPAMRKGEVVGERSWLPGMWEWEVKQRERVVLRGIAGISEKQFFERFTLVFTTNSGDERMEFVPGVGITRCHCKFFTGVFESDLRLVKFGCQKNAE